MIIWKIVLTTLLVILDLALCKNLPIAREFNANEKQSLQDSNYNEIDSEKSFQEENNEENHHKNVEEKQLDSEYNINEYDDTFVYPNNQDTENSVNEEHITSDISANKKDQIPKRNIIDPRNRNKKNLFQNEKPRNIEDDGDTKEEDIINKNTLSPLNEKNSASNKQLKESKSPKSKTSQDKVKRESEVPSKEIKQKREVHVKIEEKEQNKYHANKNEDFEGIPMDSSKNDLLTALTADFEETDTKEVKKQKNASEVEKTKKIIETNEKIKSSPSELDEVIPENFTYEKETPNEHAKPFVINSKVIKTRGISGLSKFDYHSFWLSTYTYETIINNCNITGLRIKISCSDSIARVVLDVSEKLTTRVSVKYANSVYFKDSDVEFFLFWREGEGVMVSKNLTYNDLYKNCPSCKKYAADIKLTTKNQDTCYFNVQCPITSSNKVLFLEKFAQMSDGSQYAEPLPPVHTSIKLYNDMYSNHPIGSEEVTLGSRLYLTLEAWSLDLPVDIRIHQCIAQGNDNGGIVLVKNGCNASPVIQRFEEVISWRTLRDERLERVSHVAKLTAFNTERTQQNITVLCKIMVCGLECSLDLPECVLSFSPEAKSRQPLSLFEETVVLKTIFVASGVSQNQSVTTEKPTTVEPIHIKYEDSDCISRNSVFTLIFIISAVYVIILGLCFLCTSKSTASRVHRNYVDQVESPPRSFYPDLVTTRKRSPNSSDEYLDMSYT